jgi:hypothetical protein
VSWRRDGGGVRMNRQEKRPVVVLTEEGDRQRRVCGFPTRSVTHQRSEVDKWSRGIMRRVAAHFAQFGNSWLPGAKGRARR